MTTPAIPRPMTSQEAYAAEREKRGDDPREFVLSLLSALTGSGASQLPTYSNQDEVLRKANADFRRADYSDAMDYIDSLVKIADHWQNLAENYHAALNDMGAEFYDTGEVRDVDPIAVTVDGVWVGGCGSVIRLDDPEEREPALAELVRTLARTTHEASRERYAHLIAQWTPKEPA